MLELIEQFRKDAQVLGKDGNSVEELKHRTVNNVPI